MQAINGLWPRRRHEGTGDWNIGDENAAMRGCVTTARMNQALHERIVVRPGHDESVAHQQQSFPHLRSSRDRVNGPDFANSIIFGRKSRDVNLPIVLRLLREVIAKAPIRERDKELFLQTVQEALYSFERRQPTARTRFAVGA